MSLVNKLLAIPNYYRTINPCTLSGSCDIIVIKDSKNMLSCTNFHIRFGKKHIFRLKECNVTMFVNDVHCPLNLKLGKQGEVLFEKEVEEVERCSVEIDSKTIERYNLDISRKVVVKKKKKESEKGKVNKECLNGEIGSRNGKINKGADFSDSEQAVEDGKQETNFGSMQNIEKKMNKDEQQTNLEGKNDISLDRQEECSDNNQYNNVKTADSKDEIEKSNTIDIQAENACNKECIEFECGDDIKYDKNESNTVHVKMDALDLNCKMETVSLKDTDLEAVNKNGLQSTCLSPNENKNVDLSSELIELETDTTETTIKQTKNTKRTPEEKRRMNTIRFDNRKKRLYYIRFNFFDYSESCKKQKTFYNVFKSLEHCDFISKTHKMLYHLLLGLINPKSIKNETTSCDDIRCCRKNCRSNETIGCTSVKLSFSLCLKTKIEQGKYGETFENYRSRSLENLNNLVVKISGCKKCKTEYFLPYDLFTEFFFYLRTLIFSENSGKNRKFMTYVHKRLQESYNYTGVLKEVHEYSITLSDSQLKMLKLKDGKNTLTFKIDGTSQQLSADCFLWNDDVRLIVSDIDGTITKSDAWGHVYTMIGKDWTHNGVAELFTKIYRNKYKIIYLSSRPLGQINYTKNYLFKISQNGQKLPVGPVLLSPNGLFGAIYREIISRNPQEFKIACLLDIRKLFNHNPFVSGFGNRKTDIITYHTLGIPKGKTFIIDSSGRICENIMEKRNYESLNALVENVFPPINKSCYINNDVQWWMKKQS